MNYPTRRTQKTRNYSFVIYDTPYHFLDRLSKHASISRYCAIDHDKDLHPNGEPKMPHTHILVVFENPVYYTGLIRLFTSEEWKADYKSTISVEQIVDKHSSFLYLTHESEKALEEGKPIYDTSLLISNDLPYFQRWVIADPEHEAKTTSQFLADLMTLTPFQLALKWGRDYMKNAKTYKDFIAFALEYITDESLETLPTDLKNIITNT